jgi:hypothetical protein
VFAVRNHSGGKARGNQPQQISVMDKLYRSLYNTLDLFNFNRGDKCNDRDTHLHGHGQQRGFVLGGCIMSRQSRLRQSRDQWKDKAVRRGEENRYLRKELSRVKKERDGFKEESKEAQTCLCALESEPGGTVVEHRVDKVFLALQLFLVAHIGFRAVSRVLGVLAGALGIQKVPCPQSVINWVTRLSLVRIQSASMLEGSHLPLAPSSNGFIWMIDISIGLGAGKILSVLALNAQHHQLFATAPGLEHVRCVAVSVAVSWTGEDIAAFLLRLIDVMGPPAAYLKDGGTDLRKGVRLVGEQRNESLSIDDISHVIANLLKWWYGDHPMFETFVSACGRISGNLKQTILACLTPPKVQTKARFMNVHRLVNWADRILKLSPVGGAKAGSMLSKLRACLDDLPSCRSFIKRFRDDAVPLLECQKILKTHGLSHQSLAQCEPFVQAITSTGLRRAFQAYLQRQLEVAKRLGLDKIGMPISSDPLESLFGLAKDHGIGQTKDADQIALRLPALCGIPTRAEARQVIELGVARQKEIKDAYSSLTKQRRQVLGNPERLDSLGTGLAQTHIELLPPPRTRSKSQEITIKPMGCKMPPAPQEMSNKGYG